MNGMFHWWDRRRTIDFRPCPEVKKIERSMCPVIVLRTVVVLRSPYVKILTRLMYALYTDGVHTEYLQFWNSRGLHRMHARIRIQQHMQPVRNRGLMIESKKSSFVVKSEGASLQYPMISFNGTQAIVSGEFRLHGFRIWTGTKEHLP